MGNHPYHRLSPVDPAISAKDGEPDAEKPDPRGGSKFTDYGEKKIGVSSARTVETMGISLVVPAYYPLTTDHSPLITVIFVDIWKMYV
ncbi:MAG: hypothetical protein ISS63_12850 [Desulfobacteraceae bacterium]|nr:hypothetical protein [Desulfobacteraceae bacterium]